LILYPKKAPRSKFQELNKLKNSNLKFKASPQNGPPFFIYDLRFIWILMLGSWDFLKKQTTVQYLLTTSVYLL
jgi:hypothetical protein